jgi:hypothetical protein
MQVAFRIPRTFHLFVSRVRFEAPIASYTPDDLFFFPLFGFHWPIRIGQKSAAQSDDIRLPLCQYFFSMFRVSDLPGDNHRSLPSLLPNAFSDTLR